MVASRWMPGLLCVALLGCGKQPERSSPPPRVPAVMALRLETGRLKRILTLPGELAAFESADLYPRVTGLVSEVRVDKGSQVYQGEVLAVLVAPELGADMAKARAGYLAALSTYQKLLSASRAPGVVSQEQLETSQQTVAAAHDELRALTSSEDYLQVLAPFSGFITERDVHPGDLVGPDKAQRLFRVEDIHTLRLTVPVPEAETATFRWGATVSFRVLAYPDRSFIGTIRRIPHRVDRLTRTEAVELDVANPGDSLSPGMYAEVAWPAERHEATFLVPPSAVVTTTRDTFVVGLEHGEVTWIPVRVGAAGERREEIFGDLRIGEPLAVHASDELRNGEPVEIQRFTADR